EYYCSSTDRIGNRVLF
nr:immunoglobulin light chain junction region [Macaca mulatta]MOW32041.1 immunoglobulin light chain junction region [Macaca mulatta]